MAKNAKINHSRVEHHKVGRQNWIRAGVLGANDGIVSITALVIGLMSAKSISYSTLWFTGLSALIAGAFSMAIGEYVSVASQLDIEKANIEKESIELAEEPEDELIELAAIYRHRGLSEDLSIQVAKELTAHNALEAHLRDELGMTEQELAKPAQAAFVSFFAFSLGGVLPFATSLIVRTVNKAVTWSSTSIVGFISVVALLGLGFLSANLGGAPLKKAITRILICGLFAFGISALFGFSAG